MHRIRALGLGQHWMIQRRTRTKALQVLQVTIRTNTLHPCVYAPIWILTNSRVGTGPWAHFSEFPTYCLMLSLKTRGHR